MKKARDALTEAAAQLSAVSDTPHLDAELLIAHALGVSREALILRHLDDPVPEAFAPLLARRFAHEPVAYITGTRAFWSIELAVGPGVLIPRPDSETLIEAAVAHFAGRAPRRILDLGTGPGTLLLAALAEWPDATGIGVDASEAALGYARANAEALGMATRAAFRQSDWATGLDERFDLILANPPYIAADEALPPDVSRFEPHEALFAGPDGLDAYRCLVPQLPALLAPGGVAVLEIGHTQATSVTALLAKQGFATNVVRDLAVRDRTVVAVLK